MKETGARIFVSSLDTSDFSKLDSSCTVIYSGCLGKKILLLETAQTLFLGILYCHTPELFANIM